MTGRKDSEWNSLVVTERRTGVERDVFVTEGK